MHAGDPPRLAIIGFGEIGQQFGTGLAQAGLETVVIYDPRAIAGPVAESMQRVAQAAGVELVASPAALAARADIILSATPGATTLDSAHAIAGHLAGRHLLIDLASCSPSVKRSAERVVGASGAAFVDGSIIGPSKQGYQRAVLLSGEHAARAQAALAPWGMNLEALAAPVGAASAIKILRSVVMKGLEALVVECLLGAMRYGIDARVVQSLDGSFKRPFGDLADSLASGDVIHAMRRAEEVDMSAQTLQEIGIDPIVTRAVAERLRWVGRLDTRSHFGGKRPDNYREALGAIEAELSRLGSASPAASRADTGLERPEGHR